MQRSLHSGPSQISRNILRRTPRAEFTLSGDGWSIGRDAENAVSQDYKSPGELSSKETPSLRLNNQRIRKEAP